MTLKDKLSTYTPLELKEFIKEHNKRVRKMVSEEVKEFRKKQLSNLIIKAVGKKEDLIKKMVDISNIKDVSSFKLIKQKGKIDRKKALEIDEIQVKETEKLFNDFQKKKIDKKQLQKELNEIAKERVRLELPKLKVAKLIKAIEDNIKNNKDFSGSDIKKNVVEYVAGNASNLPIPTIKITEAKPSQPKRKAPTLEEIRKKNLKEKREAMKPKREPPKRQVKQTEPIKPKGKAPPIPKKQQKEETDTESEEEEFSLPPFFKNKPEDIQKNIIKAVEMGLLSSNSIILKQEFIGMNKINRGLDTNRTNAERIEGLARGMVAISEDGKEDGDPNKYEAIFKKKLPEKKIVSEYIKVGLDIIKGDREQRRKVGKSLNNAPLEVQKKFLRADRENYLKTVSTLRDKTGTKQKIQEEEDKKAEKAAKIEEEKLKEAIKQQKKEIEESEKLKKKIMGNNK
jgi:hypothetical protein